MSDTNESRTRRTVNEPWQLALPAKVMNHIEQTAAYTGMQPREVIAATLVEHFNAVEKQLAEQRSAANPAGNE